MVVLVHDSHVTQIVMVFLVHDSTVMYQIAMVFLVHDSTVTEIVVVVSVHNSNGTNCIAVFSLSKFGARGHFAPGRLNMLGPVHLSGCDGSVVLAEELDKISTSMQAHGTFIDRHKTGA